MTRDELRTIINGISDEQLKKILDINSADIGKAKSGKDELRTQLDAAAEKILGYEEQISALNESLGEAEKVKEELCTLQKTISEREAQDLAEKKRQEQLERFKKASDGAEFLNEYTERGLFGEFCAALANEESQGMTDAELYEKITSDKGNLFIPKGAEIPSVVSVSGGDAHGFDDGDIREIMGLSR